MPTIYLKPLRAREQDHPTFNVVLEGFEEKEKIELTVVQRATDETAIADPRPIGKLKGTVSWPNLEEVPQFLITSDSSREFGDALQKVVLVTNADQESDRFEFGLSPVEADDQLALWEVWVEWADDDSVRSQPIWVSRNHRAVPPTQATYRWYPGNEVKFYNDACGAPDGSGGYFADLKVALDQAEHFILIADWSFQPYMRLNHGDDETVGELLVKWAKDHPEGLVAIHTWKHISAAPDPQNNKAGDIFQKLGAPANLLWRASSRTGIGYSHHQKFVAMDTALGEDPRRVLQAFVGGLDLTQGRFDSPVHPITPDDGPGFRVPATEPAIIKRATGAAAEGVLGKGYRIHDWYNAEFGDVQPDKPKEAPPGWQVPADTWPRQPWHDIHCLVKGPTAWDVVREFVGRWTRDPSIKGTKADGHRSAADISRVAEKFFRDTLFDAETFRQQWEPHPGNWAGQVLRSQKKEHWESELTILTPPRATKEDAEFRWTIENGTFERSIQDAYLNAIQHAQRFVYLETQFFIGSGSGWPYGPRASVRNDIQRSLISRIKAKQKANEPFHVYLILPMYPEGSPAGTPTQVMRDFQWNSISMIINAINDPKKGRDWRDWFTFGYLANWTKLKGAPDEDDGLMQKDTTSRRNRVTRNMRYQIYVHSKLMLVDDRYLIIGSANLNERSLGGNRDSEICVGLWPGTAKEADCSADAKAFRGRLWDEHFGERGDHFENPQKAASGKAIQAIGNTNRDLLFKGDDKGKKGHFVAWPVGAGKDLGLYKTAKYLVDGLSGPVRGDDWYFWPSNRTVGIATIAE